MVHLKKYFRTVLIYFFLCWTQNSWSQEIIGKVIDSYSKGDVTHSVLEVRKPLVSGKNISLSNGVTITVNEQLGEKEGIYYYDASATGKPKIPVGSDVFSEEIKSFIRGKEMFLKLERKSAFAPKKHGEITAVQKDRALVDKGSLHEVRERDLYAIYDANGKYKGKIELRGVGDFQSSGKVYRSMEDWRKKVEVEPGDKVKYLGQRKLFGLGLVIGAPLEKLHPDDRSFGGGLLWNLTFPDGWGAEVLFGGFFTQLDEQNGFKFLKARNINNLERNIVMFSEDDKFLGEAKTGDSYEISVIAPTIIKKNFFYPRLVSPFLGVGFGYFHAKYEAKKAVINSMIVADFVKGVGDQLSTVTKKATFFPIITGGANLYSGKFFQLRIETKYLMTPNLDTGFSTLKTAGFVYSIGFITAW